MSIVTKLGKTVVKTAKSYVGNQLGINFPKDGPKPKGVSSIKSHLLRPATTSHFEVEIAFPPGDIGMKLRNLMGTDQEKFYLSCCETSLPGSNLATMNIDNDYIGVTEKHVHRRVFDDVIEFVFYVDAENYLPIKIFEMWMSEIANESTSKVPGEMNTKMPDYSYTMNYPDEYIANQGLKVRKFERDYKQQLEYEFIRSFPKNISSMPVSYDSSDLLKVSVSMSYIRYVIKEIAVPVSFEDVFNLLTNPLQQARFNQSLGSMFSGIPGMAGRIAGSAVNQQTGSSFLGGAVGNVLGGNPFTGS